MFRLSNVLFGLVTLVLLFALAAPALAADTEGKLKSVAADKNEFVLTDAAAKNWLFLCEKECKIFINDKEVKLEELQAGDAAKVKYEKKDDKLMATEIRITRGT